MAASKASFIIVRKLVWRSSALIAVKSTSESLMVSRHAAPFPMTLAFWNKAKLSISTQSTPVRYLNFCQGSLLGPP